MSNPHWNEKEKKLGLCYYFRLRTEVNFNEYFKNHESEIKRFREMLIQVSTVPDEVRKRENFRSQDSIKWQLKEYKKYDTTGEQGTLSTVEKNLFNEYKQKQTDLFTECIGILKEQNIDYNCESHKD